ncbi:hypothetical protein Hanom_Chr13g01213241 [Helianthus anomalus]
MKQIEETPKEKSRALAMIQDDEGFDWSEFLPEDDAVGFAFMAQIHKQTEPTEESIYIRRKLLAQIHKRQGSTTLGKKPKTLRDGIRIIDNAKKAEKEREESKKIDDRIIDTTKEMKAEKLKNMANKVLMTKALEVDSKSASSSESSSKVSSSGSNNESGKTDGAKTEID